MMIFGFQKVFSYPKSGHWFPKIGFSFSNNVFQ